MKIDLWESISETVILATCVRLYVKAIDTYPMAKAAHKNGTLVGGPFRYFMFLNSLILGKVSLLVRRQIVGHTFSVYR
jgi:hypothetical protein